MSALPDHNTHEVVFTTSEEAVLKDEVLFRSLCTYIDQLIANDFERLISLLYRIDVSEKKLKHLLKENAGEHAGKLIATLIIERQLQKIRSRQQSGNVDKNKIDENESW